MNVVTPGYDRLASLVDYPTDGFATAVAETAAELAAWCPRTAECLEPFVAFVRGKETTELVLEPDTTPQEVLDYLCEQGVTVNRFEATAPSLNQIFLSIAGAGHE